LLGAGYGLGYQFCAAFRAFHLTELSRQRLSLRSEDFARKLGRAHGLWISESMAGGEMMSLLGHREIQHKIANYRHERISVVASTRCELHFRGKAFMQPEQI
jgi:hypothetical protein